MNQLQKTFKLFLVLFLVSSFSLLISAQEMSKHELEEHAAIMYKAGNYDKASIDYQKLYDLYPKEVKYNYAYGKSLLMANLSVSKAIDLLRYTASSNTYTDAHYYLSLAYYHAYMFDEAEISLWNFMNYSSRRERKKLKPDELKDNISKAREEFYLVKEYSLVSKKNLKEFQLEAAYTNHINGRFGGMPDSFQSEGDKVHSYKGVMFFPHTPKNGTKIYISSYEAKRSKQTDLFVVEQVTALNYTLPEILNNVNSTSNEAYPYFDIQNNVLYFSSDRPGGLGGFDIYKSVYNPSDNSFSPPSRMEFPVNTAYDDFLFVPDSMNKTAIFLSNRESFGENLTAYSISLSSPDEFVSPKDSSEINKLAYFQYVVPIKTEEKKDPERSRIAERKPQTEYDLLISQALDKQLYCDSLKSQLKVVEEQLKTSSDKNERRILFSQRASFLREIESVQDDVDRLFADARKEAPVKDVSADKIADQNESTLTRQEVNGMSVYTFTGGEIDPKKNAGNTSEMEVIQRRTEQQFQIMHESPYSINTPIPMIEDLPNGLVYRIQLGVFGKELPVDAFGGLAPLSCEILSERKLTKYYVGYFTTSKEVRKALEQVREYGYKDAFIVPYYDNRKVSIEEAREREFGYSL